MERFKKVRLLGKGAFGRVFEAIDLQTGQPVALKEIFGHFHNFDACLQLTEVKALQQMRHPNITALKEVLLKDKQLVLVYELLDKDLAKLCEEVRNNHQHIHEATIQDYIFQMLRGIDYMHKQGFFHRDLKPENILVGRQGQLLKITDFGIIKDTRDAFPYTDYVSTRWYRAPETALRAKVYGSKSDVFAVGAIMAELYLLVPLFPGHSESDQIVKICQVLGSPQEKWPAAYDLARSKGYVIPECPKKDLK